VNNTHPNPMLSRAVGKLFEVPAGALPVPVPDGLKSSLGLNRRIYCRPKQLYCRPRPAAQLLPISPGAKCLSSLLSSTEAILTGGRW
jgi:hypothetical protein